MRKYCVLLFFLGMYGCEWFSDITEEDGACTIFLVDGTTIESSENIEILESTGMMTYRDADGKLWTLSREEYQTYSCGN